MKKPKRCESLARVIVGMGLPSFYQSCQFSLAIYQSLNKIASLLTSILRTTDEVIEVSFFNTKANNDKQKK